MKMGKEDRIIISRRDFEECLDYVFNSNEDYTMTVLQYLALQWKDTQIGNIHKCRENQKIFSDVMWNLLDRLPKQEDEFNDKNWEDTIGI